MKQFPNEKRFAMELIKKLIQTQQYDKALKRLKPLTKIGSNENQAEVHLLLATVYLAQEDFKEALAGFAEAEKLNPLSIETVAHRLLQGEILQSLEKTEDAIAAYRAAHSIDGRAPEPLIALIELLSENEETKPEAIKNLQELVNIAGDDADWVIQVADAYLVLDRFQQAFDLATRIAPENPSSPVARILGISLAKQGEWESALPHLEKVVKDDQDLLFLESAVDAELHQGNLSKALEFAGRFKGIDESAPFDVEAVRERLKTMTQSDPGKKNPKAIEILLCAELLQKQSRSSDEIRPLLDRIAPTWV